MPTVLITGTASGIGQATAQAFLAEGWTVYATDLDETDLTDLAEAGAETDTLDVTDQSDVDRVLDRVLDETDGLDCLVNNAGFGQYGPVEDVDPEPLIEQFEVNTFGAYRMLHAVVPHMREQESGTIVTLSSVAGRLGVPGASAYSGSKFALEGICEALSGEVQSLGIDVVLLEPGPVRTGFGDRAEAELADVSVTDAYEGSFDLAEQLKEAAKPEAGGRSIDPEDVAERVLTAAQEDNPPLRQPVGLFAESLVD